MQYSGGCAEERMRCFGGRNLQPEATAEATSGSTSHQPKHAGPPSSSSLQRYQHQHHPLHRDLTTLRPATTMHSAL